MTGFDLPSVSARSSSVRRSLPHSTSMPFALSTFRASSYVMRSKGGLTSFRNSGVRPKATMSSEVFVDGAEDRVTDAEDARHLLRTDPQMPDVEEELFAQVFLDRELLREVDDLEVVRLDLIPPGGPLVGDDFSVDDHRGLDQRLLCGLKCFGRYGIPRDRRLKDPRRVPDDDEGLPPDRPGAVDPASQLDDFAGVASFEDFSDGDHEPQSHPAGSRLHFRGPPASEKSDSPPIRGRCPDGRPGSKRTTTPGAVRASDVARRGAGRPR